MAGQQTIPNLTNDEPNEHTQVAQLPPVEELVQVVYRSDPQGALVGVESTSLVSSYPADHSSLPLGGDAQLEQPAIASGHQQLSRAASTLPSVAEESSSSGPTGGANGVTNGAAFLQDDGVYHGNEFDAAHTHTTSEEFVPPGELPIYSTIQRHQQPLGGADLLSSYTSEQQQQSSFANKENELIDYAPAAGSEGEEVNECERVSEEIGAILGKQRAAGAVEKGSFRNNFRKKLGLSASTNENDLTAHRQKFIESVQDDEKASSAVEELQQQQQQQQHAQQQHQLQAASRAEKFKRTHSVSFNVHGARANRHSVDIRNLPSYLTHKRASIVDVAKGAMSSLISSFGGGGSSSNSIVSGRRDSTQEPNVSEPDDDELDDQAPIFEEPIAPTLSLGQRVAMVRNSGTEFGTVGWIGQLADVDDDWVVGVIFDNMIGDCDGAYKGARYFYARDNYAMFVPLQALTKTDNYIGRPETGTVLSRMSVSLKPGQLISIQRSSIRLQHCFLNAPHQRVGHDVRAVSNRLHCQCHNCGPCAHLTKQGRPNVLPHFGAHHLPHRKHNSLAHAAVQMLAHHHHHFHEEEEHEEKDYEFGDNSAHACNFVRYSCCQQSGQPGHEFSTDCGMVRPELLDNLIHAPKAPHRRSRPRRPRALAGQPATGQPTQRAPAKLPRADQKLPIEGADCTTTQQQQQTNTLETNQSTLGFTNDTVSTIKTTTTTTTTTRDDDEDNAAHGFYSLSSGSSSRSSHSSRSSSSSSPSRSGSSSPPRSSFAANSQLQAAPLQEPYNYYQYDTSSFRPQNNVFQTVESQVSIVDQQRYVYRRDSAAYVHSTARGQASDWSDTSSAQISSTGNNLGKRILRCLGCLKQQRRKRKLSFRDRVLEYRRRQSTFVPSTLAKPHEDFASHGIILNSGGGGGGLADSRPTSHHQQAANSDYSSCSKSGSSCSSRSHSPDRDALGAGLYQTQQTTTMTMEHGLPNDQELKSAAWPWNHHSSYYQNKHADDNYKPQLNYGDYNFNDGYNNELNKKGTEDLSKDSALISEFPYSDTYKTNSSSDTLKFLIDQSINEQVLPMTPMQEQDCLVSPISSSQAAENRGESATSDQVDISSPTASAIDGEYEQGQQQQQLELQESLENLLLNSPDDCNQSPPDAHE